MTQQTINTDTVFLRQLYFKDLVNNPIPANQVLLTRGDGGVYFGSPFSNQSTIPYGFTQFIGGSNALSTNATANNTRLWLDSAAGIVVNQLSTDKSHYIISATAPEQIIVGNNQGPTQTLNFSSLRDDPYGGRTLYYEGLGDTLVSISDTTIYFQSQYNSSFSSLQEALSTQESVNNETSSLISTITYELSTINLFIYSTGISSVLGNITAISNVSYDLSTFVYSTFTGPMDEFGSTTYTKLNVNQISTNHIATSSLLTNYIYTNTNQIGSTILFDATATGDSNSFCSPFVSDGTVSTATDFFIIDDRTTSTQFAIQKQLLYSESLDGNNDLVITQGQQVQLGFIPFLSTQGHANPPVLGDRFVPILQQIQVVQTLSNCGSNTITEYVLKNTGRLDEICATGDIWLNGSTVTISSLWVSSINGLTPGSGGGGGTTQQISTFSTLYVSTAYLETTVASSIQISTVMGQVLPILTMDIVNNRLGVNLGPIQQPRATLDVNGIVYAGNFVTTSDRRLKWNIREMDPIDAEDIPNGYRFSSADAPSGDVGCMADEVEAIAPECVYTTPAGFKAVAYPKLVPICLSLIRGLTARVAALEQSR
jgi:hypothetical protein